MDRAPEDLQFLSIRDIIRESTSIPKQSPNTFCLVTLTLIFPLSFAILAHSLSFPSPYPLLLLDCSSTETAGPAEIYHKWTLLLLLQLCYFIFLFAFSLLTTAAVIFTVASLYTSRPVSFSNTLSALPKLFKRLFITFPRASLVMVGGNFLLVGWLDLVNMAMDSHVLGFYYGFVLIVLYLMVYIYATALWYLASVVSVLEPVYGFAALEKSYELLKGNTGLAYVLVIMYVTTCGVILGLFDTVVVYGGSCCGVFVRIVVGGFLVGVLVIVNLVDLLLQSMFYFVCKSSHHQRIDKNALHDHLGEYVASQN